MFTNVNKENSILILSCQLNSRFFTKITVWENQKKISRKQKFLYQEAKYYLLDDIDLHDERNDNDGAWMLGNTIVTILDRDIRYLRNAHIVL